VYSTASVKMEAFWVRSRHLTSSPRCRLCANFRHGPFRRPLIHRPNCVMLNLDLENLDFASVASRLARGFGGSMSVRPFGKILFLGAFASLLAVVAVPILFRADMQSAAANRTLNCYDSGGNYEPCVTRASASPSQFNGRTTGAHQPANWTTTALYQQTIWPTNAVDQPVNWTTSAPPARRSSTPGKRPATCGRHLIPCFFSALRRGVTHIASVAATVGQARPAREHL